MRIPIDQIAIMSRLNVGHDLLTLLETREVSEVHAGRAHSAARLPCNHSIQEGD